MTNWENLEGRCPWSNAGEKSEIRTGLEGLACIVPSRSERSAVSELQDGWQVHNRILITALN